MLNTVVEEFELLFSKAASQDRRAPRASRSAVFPSCSADVLNFLGLWEVWLPSALAMRPLASEILASVSECLLPLAEGSCGQGFWVSGKWGAVLELGDLGALGDLPLLLPRVQHMFAGCLSQNLSTGWRILGDPYVPPCPWQCQDFTP